MTKLFHILFFFLFITVNAKAEVLIEASLESRVSSNTTTLSKMDSSLNLNVSQEFRAGQLFYLGSEVSRRSLDGRDSKIAVDNVELGYSFYKENLETDNYLSMSFYFQGQTNSELMTVLNTKGAVGFYSTFEKSFIDGLTVDPEFSMNYYLPKDKEGWGLVSDLFFSISGSYQLNDKVALTLPLKQYIEFYTNFDTYGSYLSIVPAISYKFSRGPSIDLYCNYLVSSNSKAEFLYTNYSRGFTYGLRLNW